MTARAGSAVPSRRTGAVVAALVVVLAIGAPVSTTAQDGSRAVEDSEPQNESDEVVVPANVTEDDQTAVPEQQEQEQPPEEPPQAPVEEPEPAEPVPQQGPEADVTVDLEDDDEAITAGDAETVELEVTNDENDEVTDVVVTLQAGSPLYLGSPSNPQSTRSIYVDELGEDETETLEVDVGTSRAEPGTYPLFATVEYVEDEDDEPTVGGPTALGVEVDEEREFGVENVTRRVTIDREGVYAVRITNEGDEAVTGVVATMETAPPLSSASPTAYVGTLGPDESRTARFALEVSEDAVATRDSVAITLGYETAAGTDERTTTGPKLVPVTITEDEDETDVDTLLPFVVVGLVLVLAAVWWFRRR